MAKKRKMEEICFPVPKNFLMPAAPAQVSPRVKADIFRKTVQGAFQISIPSRFTTSYQPEKPHQIASDDQLAMIASLFEALNPENAVEMALAQQFIVVHMQAISSATTSSGLGSFDLKMLELSHQIIETFLKLKTKGAQIIQVQYNHNQAQYNNVTINKNSNKNETIDVC